MGTSCIPSEINMAYLYAQLEIAEEINNKRQDIWKLYYKGLKDVREVELPVIPPHCAHNAHMFYIKVKNHEVRSKLMAFLKERKINAVFHYIPLHSAPAGKKYGRFNGKDVFTTAESERLLRLPMHMQLEAEDAEYVIESIKDFFYESF